MPTSRNRHKAPKKRQTAGRSSKRPQSDDFGFPVDFSFTQRVSPFQNVPREVLDREAIAHSERARIALARSVDALNVAIQQVPPFQALADFALYGLLARPGHDPELDSPNPILQYHVELLQAFALRHELHEFSTDMMAPSQFEEIHRLIRESTTHFTSRAMADGIAIRDDPKAAARLFLRDAVRVDTMAVRNWGYVPQIRRIVYALFAPLESDIERAIGLRISALLQAIDSLAERRADVIHQHRLQLQPIRKAPSVAEALEIYNRLGIGPRFELGELEEVRRTRRLRPTDLKLFLTAQATNAASASFYTFTLNEIATAFSEAVDPNKLHEILNRLSLAFGALKDSNAEHFFMANPVWQRPFIRMPDATFFLPIPGMIWSFPLEIIRTLIADAPALVAAYERRRAVFLEEESARLLQGAFPNDVVYPRSQWLDPTTQTLYENDALIVVGRHVVVLEAKSGQLRAAGRRGAPSMSEDLNALLVEAATQASRFAGFLESHPGDHTFARRDGGVNEVRIPRNAKVVTLSITLEDMGSLATRWRDLQTAGIAPLQLAPVPSMSVAAFESVCELLPLACQKLHYLQRRQEFEEHARYDGDELDLLAFYLYSSFNIGDVEFSRDEVGLSLTGLSKLLDPYFTREHFGIKVKPVRQRLTPWWLDLLTYIERRRVEGWSRVGTTLLNVAYHDQVEFERAFRVVQDRVRRCDKVAPGMLDRVVLSNGPQQRRDALVALAYKQLSREDRNRRLISAGGDGLDASGAQFAWVLAVDTDLPQYPYNVSLVVADKQVIESLT